MRHSVAVERPLALYGAGNLGLLARAYCERVGIELHFVVDRAAASLSTSPQWHGCVLQTPAQVAPAARREVCLAVSIVTEPFGDIERKLASAGWNEVIPFYDIAESFRDRHPLSNGWFADPLDSGAAGQVAQALDRWDDDISRAHHLQFLAWRRLREEWRFDHAPVRVEERFACPEVVAALGDDESLLDIGAHTGSFVRLALALLPSLRRLWAIEPDPYNMARLHAWLFTLPDGLRQRVELLPHLLASTSGVTRFHAGLDYASQCTPLGSPWPCASVDDLELHPTLIKLHVEGAELDLLRGARRTLERQRPIVMATSYHNDDGISRLPIWLHEQLPGYRLHFRMHGWCGTGAVIYAIPAERPALNCGDGLHATR